MAKQNKAVFKCTSCSHIEYKWLGRCPNCGQWNTLLESYETKKSISNKSIAAIPLEDVDPHSNRRYSSGFTEVDRVLGGGIMVGSSVIIGGEPGIGKSTLLLQIAAQAKIQGRVLYISGEESAGNIKLRADRLGVKRSGLELLCTCQLEEIIAVLNNIKPAIVVVDSLQTLFSNEIGSVAGSVNQVKYCAAELSDWAREHNSSAFLVAHVTKDGLIAGPKAAEHTVDVVLMFEQSDHEIRFLRAMKNRFGPSDELGLFSMSEQGLVEVTDPSSLFLVRRENNQLPAGVTIAATWEGSRALLVEIQALTVPCKAALSRVYSEKIEPARVSRVAAVLEKQLGISLSDNDIYVNVAGGIRLSEPGIDLALAIAIYSAHSGLSVQYNTSFAGELSLAGELRLARRMSGRTKTALSMGFTQLIGALDNAENTEACNWQGAANINQAIQLVFGPKSKAKS